MNEIVGSGKYRYRVNGDWQKPPEQRRGPRLRGRGRLAGPGLLLQPQHGPPDRHLRSRRQFPVGSWGAGLFKFPHAIRIVRERKVRLAHRRASQPVLQIHHRRRAAADDRRARRALRHRRAGRRLQLDRVEEGHPWRRPVQPADRHRLRAGRLDFMSDGYGNARVHKFSPDREMISSRGASRARRRASSTCRTGCGSTGAAGCWWPTARTTACRCSTRTAICWRSGRSS